MLDEWLTAAEPAALDVVQALGIDLDPAEDLEVMRARSREVIAALAALPLPAGVTRSVEEPGGPVLPLRVMRPDAVTRPGRAILWIHGGGLIGGAPEQDDLLCAELALAHGCPVISVQYRLAPEHPYPAGIEDCFAALRHVLEHGAAYGLAPGGLLVCGASAGGGLAAGVALLARDRGLPGLRGLCLYYPMLDDRPGRASMEATTFARTWHRGMDELAWRCYLPERSDVPVYAAPGRAAIEQLRGLPPTFIDVGALDAFLDEDIAFAVALAHAGVPVELLVTPRAFHGSEALAPQADSSRRIVAARRSAQQRLLDA